MSEQNETLFDKAIQNMEIAKLIRRSVKSDDEAYLNYIGYHIQQAVELAFKHLLELNGIAYPYTHDITQLIKIANENHVNWGDDFYIDTASGTLTLWESQTRYVKNYKIELRKIDEAINRVPIFLQSIQKLEMKLIQPGDESKLLDESLLENDEGEADKITETEKEDDEYGLD